LNPDNNTQEKESFFIPEEQQSQRFIPFYLSEDFVKGYAKKKVLWGPLGEFTFLRTYSRWIDLDNGKKRKEKWHETIKRVVEGCFTIQKKHCYVHKVPWNNTKAQNSAKIMFDLMFNMKFLPSGRGLWMMGTEYLNKKNSSMCLINCAFVSTKNIAHDPITPFKFLMDVSMLAVGCSFDTLGAGQIIIKKPKYIEQEVFIPDTREGWVETMSITLNGFFSGSSIPKFNYSKIRPYGSPIKGFGGEASGPEPLIKLVSNIRNLLTPKIGKIITSSLIVDLFNMIGKCVVSGNVRRTAEGALGDKNDKEFMNLKNFEKYPKQNSPDGWRWCSNNSIKVDVGQDYSYPASLTAINGEPGYVWIDNARKYGRMIDPKNDLDYKVLGVNPCFEISLEDMGICNLVETFPSRHDSYDDYQLTLKYAYLYGKTVTLIPTHWQQTNAVMLRTRRIGMSQSGITDAFARHGRPIVMKWCDQGYKYLRKLDEIYSDWLCIPRSIKITTVKPSGTVSLLPGVSPGIHYPHSKYYIRRIRIDKNSSLTKIMKKAGYNVENDKMLENTSVISFPIKTNDFIKGKEEASIWEQVANAVDYQKWWADNQVSITVSFKDYEAKDIKNVLTVFDSCLKGISFLPLHTKPYPQMPYEEITEEKYKQLTSKLLKPDYSNFLEDAIGEKYCDSDKCTI